MAGICTTFRSGYQIIELCIREILISFGGYLISFMQGEIAYVAFTAKEINQNHD